MIFDYAFLQPLKRRYFWYTSKLGLGFMFGATQWQIPFLWLEMQFDYCIFYSI